MSSPPLPQLSSSCFFGEHLPDTRQMATVCHTSSAQLSLVTAEGPRSLLPIVSFSLCTGTPVGLQQKNNTLPPVLRMKAGGPKCVNSRAYFIVVGNSVKPQGRHPVRCLGLFPQQVRERIYDVVTRQGEIIGLRNP